MNAPGLQPAPGVAGVAPYRPGPRPAGIDLFLDANEGPAPPEDVLDAIRLAGIGAARLYPSAAALERQIAERHGIDPERVVVTAGGDDALDRACRAVLTAGSDLLLPVPTFEMFHRYARLAGAHVREVPWRGGEPFPAAAVLHAATPATRAVAFVSPNNPTGAAGTRADLDRIARSLPGALVICDFAYAEFADEDLTRDALEHRNCVVVRTFSKAWGLAGLRVGYAMAGPEVATWLRAAGGPFAVSGLSLAVASAWLRRSEARVREAVARVRQERGDLARLLAALGATPWPSQANFVAAAFPSAPAARHVHAMLWSRGISVRRFDSAALSNVLRITCPGGEPGWSRLASALRDAALEPTRGAEEAP